MEKQGETQRRLWLINRIFHKRISLISFRGSVTKGVGRSRQRAWTFFESTHLTTAARAVVSHSHGGKRRGRKVTQSGWRENAPSVSVGREDCTSRCADAWVRVRRKPQRGLSTRGASVETRLNRDAALFHHTAAAKILGGNREQQALELSVHRDGASQVRCSAASATTSARLSERDGVKSSAHRLKPARNR